MASLLVSAGSLGRLRRWAEAAAPHEACGPLFAHPVSTDGTRLWAPRSRNLRIDPGAFELDPLEVLRLWTRWRRMGIEWVGVWHSHPGRPARPSDADGESAWLGSWQLIVPVAAGTAGVAGAPRVWQRTGAGWREVRLSVRGQGDREFVLVGA